MDSSGVSHQYGGKKDLALPNLGRVLAIPIHFIQKSPVNCNHYLLGEERLHLHLLFNYITGVADNVNRDTGDDIEMHIAWLHADGGREFNMHRHPLNKNMLRLCACHGSVCTLTSVTCNC